MVMTDRRPFALIEQDDMIIVPGERYTSREYFDLEMERLWPRVWQIACREEEVPNTGDYFEYMIGEQSILVVRTDADTIKAYFNVCTHRGTRLANGIGNFATGEIRCRYHAWRWDLCGDLVQVVDREDFPPAMTDDKVGLREVQVGFWGGFVFINMDASCESFDDFIQPIRTAYAKTPFHQMRFRSYRTTVFGCNWKTVIDSFNEGYHPQGTHPQMLTWFDDTLFQYETLGKHSRYGGKERRQRLGPSPRLGLSADDFDERELVANQVNATSGLYSREDRALLDSFVQNGLPEGKTAVQVFDEIRINRLKRSGMDLSGLTDEELLNGDGTIHIFPNFLGPISRFNATVYRALPNGMDPDSTVMDFWALEWSPPGEERGMPERKFYEDWASKDWGLINNQDYANYAEIQAGMKSRGYPGARLNPRQEANLIHFQRVMDLYMED